MEATVNDFQSDDERKAAFAAMAESGSEKSESASKASKSANRKGTAEAHKAAATAHTEAAMHHAKSGNTELAQSHKAAAKEHRAAAKATNNEEDAMTPERRKELITTLTANCGCESDKEKIAGLSDKMLIALNAKAEGSNADTIDDPKTAKAVKDKEDEEDGNDKIAKGDEGTVKNKKEMSDNEWLAAAPPSIRSAVRNAMQIEGVERVRLIKKLVANVAGEERRKALVAKFSDSRQYDLAALQELVSLLPTTNDLRREADESVANYLGASAPAANAFSDEDKSDILPLPVMDWGEVKQNKA